METARFYHPPAPSLDDIVLSDPYTCSGGPFSRSSFLDFLATSHCAENWEFIQEVDRFVSRLKSSENAAFLDDAAIIENSALLRHWAAIYNAFLNCNAPKELNIPGKFTDHLSPYTLPDTTDLATIRKLAYELLSSNYNDFLTYTRESQGESRVPGRPVRRRSETVAPESLSPEQHPRPMRPSPSWLNHESSELSAQWEKALEEYETSHLECSSKSECSQSRNNSAGTISTRSTSRGSSFGSIMETIRDLNAWRKTVKKLRPRRSSSEKPDILSL